MQKEITRLHALGLAIHLLKTKSKAPLESKWTTGNKKPLNDLLKNYKPGMNIGIRLGKESKIKNGYFAVIDCDVKSVEPSHLREMEKKLNELFPHLAKQNPPTVLSGRGNGSRHIYVATSAPVSSKRLSQSVEKVKVLMPSIKASQKDIETLRLEDIKKGYRSRAAWEISLMGEGAQVVAPPSIHPDSLKPYKWGKVLLKSSDIPLVAIGEVASVKANVEAVAGGFKPVPYDLRKLSDKMQAIITEGEGVDDRSGALLSAALAMVRQDFSHDEIKTILTNTKYYLGRAAYDHAKTNDRNRAANWIERYTLKKAFKEGDARNDFLGEVTVKDLPEKEAKVLHEKANEATHWELKLERTSDKVGAKVKGTFKNIKNIITKGVAKNVFVHNEFSGADFYGTSTPWGGSQGDEIRDIDLINLKSWFADKYGFEPNKALNDEVVQHLAHKNRFHPVRKYLNALKWDGVARVDTWLRDYLNAKAPEPYLSSVSRKMLVAMVARIYEPGKKYDQVVILQGNQGYGKSTVLRNLVGDEWFSDATLNVQDKDSVLAMRGMWLRELGELSGMRKTDTEALKEFVSRTTDRIRVPYGKRTEAFPRQCIFVGTTNKDEFLKDETGNRRFWPVAVGRCKFNTIKKVRDQLFAEACYYYEMGEALYLDNEKAEKIAVEEQSKRMETDMLAEQVSSFVETEYKKPKNERFNFDKFTLNQAFDAGFFGTMRDDKSSQMRAGNALKVNGFKKYVGRIDGKFLKYWGMLPP